MKKILIITYYWPPSGGAGVQRWLKFCKYLPEFGIEPYVVTVNPDVASYAITDVSLNEDLNNKTHVFTTSTREPFNLYKKVVIKKEIPHSGFANEGKPNLIQKVSRYIRGNFFIPDARIGWNKFALEKCRELLRTNNFEAIITTSPPHSTQLIGLTLKKEFNLPWVADLRDPWTDIYYYKEMLHTQKSKQKDAALEKQVLEQADNVIVVSKAIKKLFANKSKNIKLDKIHIIPNGFDEDDFKGANTVISIQNFIINYTGTLSKDYPVSMFLDALSEVETERKIELNFTGKIAAEIKLNNKNIQLNKCNYITHKESVNKIINSSLLLLIIPRIENNTGILTGKLFEYLAVQKPILCIGPPNGDAAQIITECQAGKTFDYDDKIGIKKHLFELINHPECVFKNNEVYKKYSRKILTKNLVMLLNQKNI